MPKHKYILLIVLAIAGCKSAIVTPQAEPVTVAAEGVAGIVAHTQSAERHVTNAVPHADATGKVQLSAASDEHQAILSDAAKTRTALVAAQQQVSSMADTISDQKLAYQKLKDKWYVVWGRRIERALWIIGITWLLLGIGSVVLGIGNPLSWGSFLGKELIHLAPFMNPFGWVRDWLAKRKAAQSPASPAGV